MSKTALHPDWPVLKTYDRDHLARIALPLGGIGTGHQHRLAFEFFGASAADAHHVVVITVITLGKLKATAPFTEFQLLQKPHVRQQAQGSVHSGQ